MFEVEACWKTSQDAKVPAAGITYLAPMGSTSVPKTSKNNVYPRWIQRDARALSWLNWPGNVDFEKYFKRSLSLQYRCLFVVLIGPFLVFFATFAVIAVLVLCLDHSLHSSLYINMCLLTALTGCFMVKIAQDFRSILVPHFQLRTCAVTLWPACGRKTMQVFLWYHGCLVPILLLPKSRLSLTLSGDPIPKGNFLASKKFGNLCLPGWNLLKTAETHKNKWQILRVLCAFETSFVSTWMLMSCQAIECSCSSGEF